MAIILAIESSCDETAVAILKDKNAELASNVQSLEDHIVKMIIEGAL